MAFIGLLVANFVLLFLVLGFFSLLIGLFIDIIWIIRARLHKKTNLFVKILAVLFSIGGFMGFIFPICSFLLLGKIGEVSSKNTFEKLPNKVYVQDADYLQNGFEFMGKKLVPIEGMNHMNVKKKEAVGAVVTDEEARIYTKILPLENMGGFEMYELEQKGKYMVPEDQLEEIMHFYRYEAEVETSAYINIQGEKTETECEFDRNMLYEIRDYYDNRGSDFYCTSDEIEATILISIHTEDHLMYESISLAKVGDDLILESVFGGNGMRGITLDEEKKAYVYKALGKYLTK